MSLLEDQSQTQAMNDKSDAGISSDGFQQFLAPPLISHNHPSSETRTLHDETEISNNQDLEKGSVELSGRYAKYAGEPPDGGLKAWSVILASALTACAAFGFANAWGIYQSYYEEVMLPNESPSNIAWIGSVQYALVFLPGPITGRLFDIGYFKVPYFIASCLMIACTFLVAECTEYWQFFLVQGLGIGLASGIMFGPALGVVSHWFLKRRGLALGLTAFGSSVGGTVFPIAAQNLIPEVGFKWTMRIFGFILLFLLGTAALMIDRRLPPINVKGGLFNLAAFKNPVYAIYCISGTTTFLGLYTVLTYIPLSAVQVGIPSNFAYYLIAIANGSSTFGRISAGVLADYFGTGAVNIMVPFIIVAAAMTFVWPFVVSKGGLIAISVIYGISCGTYVSLLSIPAIVMGNIEDVGRRIGMFLGFAALGALTGTPISGSINSTTGSFTGVGWYAGSMLIFSVCLLLLTRYLHLRKLTGKF